MVETRVMGSGGIEVRFRVGVCSIFKGRIGFMLRVDARVGLGNKKSYLKKVSILC